MRHGLFPSLPPHHALTLVIFRFMFEEMPGSYDGAETGIIGGSKTIERIGQSKEVASKGYSKPVSSRFGLDKIQKVVDGE